MRLDGGGPPAQYCPARAQLSGAFTAVWTLCTQVIPDIRARSLNNAPGTPATCTEQAGLLTVRPEGDHGAQLGLDPVRQREQHDRGLVAGDPAAVRSGNTGSFPHQRGTPIHTTRQGGSGMTRAMIRRRGPCGVRRSPAAASRRSADVPIRHSSPDRARRAVRLGLGRMRLRRRAAAGHGVEDDLAGAGAGAARRNGMAVAAVARPPRAPLPARPDPYGIAASPYKAKYDLVIEVLDQLGYMKGRSRVLKIGAGRSSSPPVSPTTRANSSSTSPSRGRPRPGRARRAGQHHRRAPDDAVRHAGGQVRPDRLLRRPLSKPRIYQLGLDRLLARLRPAGGC